MSKKSFLDAANPAEMFITQPDSTTARADESTEAPQQTALAKILGRIEAAPERKSRRIQLLIKPSTAAALTEAAESHCISVNELINLILEAAIKGDSSND